ncbi:hypothetical protein D3C72_1562160 [compost metagenome]
MPLPENPVLSVKRLTNWRLIEMPSSAPIASSTFSPGITAFSDPAATKASSRNVLSEPARKGKSVLLLACAVKNTASRSAGVDWYCKVAGSLVVVMATRCEVLSDANVVGVLIWNDALVASFCTCAVCTSTGSGIASAMAASA